MKAQTITIMTKKIPTLASEKDVTKWSTRVFLGDQRQGDEIALTLRKGDDEAEKSAAHHAIVSARVSAILGGA